MQSFTFLSLFCFILSSSMFIFVLFFCSLTSETAQQDVITDDIREAVNSVMEDCQINASEASVFLVGSRGREDHRPDSDIDLVTIGLKPNVRNDVISRLAEWFSVDVDCKLYFESGSWSDRKFLPQLLDASLLFGTPFSLERLQSEVLPELQRVREKVVCTGKELRRTFLDLLRYVYIHKCWKRNHYPATLTTNRIDEVLKQFKSLSSQDVLAAYAVIRPLSPFHAVFPVPPVVDKVIDQLLVIQ